jgi:hypothetical protein
MPKLKPKLVTQVFAEWDEGYEKLKRSKEYRGRNRTMTDQEKFARQAEYFIAAYTALVDDKL